MASQSGEILHTHGLKGLGLFSRVEIRLKTQHWKDTPSLQRRRSFPRIVRSPRPNARSTLVVGSGSVSHSRSASVIPNGLSPERAITMPHIGRLPRTPQSLRNVRALHSTIKVLPIELETFGRLAPWASSNLSSDSFVSVLVRHHDHRPYGVQRALFTQIANNDKATTRIDNNTTPTLDLTPFETTSGLIFLFWLFNRRLPTLQTDCALPPPKSLTTPANETELKLDARARIAHQRLQAETFTLGLIDAWRMGSCLHAPRFQNDILRMVAKRLETVEVEALKTDEPNYSYAVKWARQAFDGLSASPLEALEDGGRGKGKGRELREFAVDVAAKRVYDVGMNSLLLSFSERENLGTNPQFASEVFGSLGGQIGTKGVGIMDFARAYLVAEDTK